MCRASFLQASGLHYHDCLAGVMVPGLTGFNGWEPWQSHGTGNQVGMDYLGDWWGIASLVGLRGGSDVLMKC